MLGDAVLPLSIVDVRGESIDGAVGRSRLFVEDSLRSVVRRGLLYTEHDAQGLGCLRRTMWLMYGIKRVVFYYGKRGGEFVCRGAEWRTSIRPNSVGGVVARDKDVTGSCLAIAGTRLPCFTLGGKGQSEKVRNSSDDRDEPFLDGQKKGGTDKYRHASMIVRLLSSL